jgi:hypothetical protein
MPFVTPALLFGAALIAVPVVLHLVMRQQPKHVEFPPLQFLKVRRESNRRRLRLRHLLLLLLRAGAICLLALSLARPSIEGSGFLGGEEAPVAAALVFDTAPRMDYRHENRVRLEEAQEMADWLLTQLPRKSEVAVIDSRAAQPTFAVDLGAAKDRVDRLRMTPVAQPVVESIGRALELLDESELKRREIYVFTDLARATWTDSSGQLAAKLAAQSEVGVYVIDVGVAEPRNFGLDEPRPNRQLLAQGSPLVISSNVLRVGPAAPCEVELYLLDENGAPQKRGQQTIDAQPGAAQPVEFTVGGLEAGAHQGYLQIAGQDALVWDDRRFLSVEVRPAWRVLVAATEPDYAVYLTEALAPQFFRARGQARFECDVVDLKSLKDQPLSDYAAVCLVDPRPLDEDTWRSLGEYVRTGGAAAIFLGRHARPMAEMNSSVAQRLLPGEFKRVWSSPSYLSPRDLSHPLLAKFRPLETSIPWKAFPVFSYWQLASLAEGATTIIPFATGHPALIEKSVGEGRVLTLTTPVSDPANLRNREPWNTLPTGAEPWPFVMLVNEMMLYLVGSQDQRFNYDAGERVELRGGLDGRITMVSLAAPDGDFVRKSVDPKQNSIVVSAADQPGNYRLRAGGGETGYDRGFSINLAPQLTELARLDKGELDATLGADRYRLAANRDQIQRDVNIGRVGRELFPFTIMILALLLAGEHLLANRFYRKK